MDKLIFQISINLRNCTKVTQIIMLLFIKEMFKILKFQILNQIYQL